jgi:hypothetical protein
MSKLSSGELVDRGHHIPPFHPRCRGLLTRKGKAPTLAQIDQGKVPTEVHQATEEDFEALGWELPAEKVKLWNKAVKLPPANLASNVKGVSLDTLLAEVSMSSDPSELVGLKSLSVTSKGVRVKFTDVMHGSKEPITVGLKFAPDGSALTLSTLSVHDSDKSLPFLKKIMQSLYTTASDAGAKTLALDKTGGYGSYAWAKSGFKPSPEEWQTLKNKAYSALSNAGLIDTQSEAVQKVLAGIKTSTDPSDIFALADLPVGQAALFGLGWSPAFDLTDAESVARFLTYFGGK